MLIVVLLLALSQTLESVPLSPPAGSPDPFFALDHRETESHFGQRTVNDIVLSCFATIFACTWSAIHPNIPAPTDCWWTRFKRQVTIMIYALLAPELITIWALRQRMGAKWIMEKYNREILGESTPRSDMRQTMLEHIQDIPRALKRLFHDSPPPTASLEGPRWTVAHGFLVLMGGFMLSENGQPIYTLIQGPPWDKMPASQQMIDNIKNKTIYAPRITEEDIQDRSKGDAISKTLVILQTTWFIVQCIARWSQHLPVTELEVVTLAFALLNGVTYTLWWDKPQNVGRPVLLERQISVLDSVSGDVPATATAPNDAVQPTNEAENAAAEAAQTEKPEAAPILLHVPPRKESQVNLLWKIIGGDQEVFEDRVSIFYTPDVDMDDITFSVLVPVVGTLFGAVHLIPSWFLDFASRQEMWLWRASAIIITAIPSLPVVTLFLWDFGSFMQCFLVTPAAVGYVLYPVARIILLTLALTSLRSLSSSALESIEWTTFIPHL
ncbi:hypothetical protein BDN70DRAFT_885670 [Pholiota conissans]|uniref:Uncharacterized protein n=1 Tax=Pholiota conissans TaxID=109636 RepID=A0A9P5YQL7_9AGAR|nr:hypothetical protein BDN70DRAFT_885670 [Pholiota conissans]